ncbi:hypothetical protein AB8O38_08405 [Saccharomonospora xinjiangensis]|uniref:hypothetical protein n=1 Tax=Saccharomonospora xinjiangensis TaxID=75294 RepID=UPI00350FF895
MRVTADDVRTLLTSDDPTARLVLHEGGFRVLGEKQWRSADYAGALEVAGRQELRDQLGGAELSAADYERIAAGLTVEITNQGG